MKAIQIACAGAFMLMPVLLSAQPEFKSDVRKEYDENGNIIQYDSSFCWSYNGGKGFDFDSAFTQFFNSHPFDFHFDHFPPFPERLFDSPDSLRYSGREFSWQDSARTGFPDPWFPDFEFPGFAFPDEDFYEFHGMPDIGRIMEEHMERMRQLLEQYRSPADSIQYYQPGRKAPPEGQGKSYREIEI